MFYRYHGELELQQNLCQQLGYPGALLSREIQCSKSKLLLIKIFSLLISFRCTENYFKDDNTS